MKRGEAAAVLSLVLVAGCYGATPHQDGAGDAYVIAHTTSPYADTLPDAWACGDQTCLDPASWHPVSAELADALAEGAGPDATARDWTRCYETVGDTSYYACPDGWTESS